MSKKQDKQPVYKKWWFWVLAIIIVGSWIVNGNNDSAKNNEDEAKETVAEQENDKEKAKKEEEERLANRTIDEILEEDENDVDKAELEDGVLRLERDVTTFWDETSILKQDVLRMFELLPKAFEDDEVERVRVVLNTEMVDQKGNAEMESVIYYEYSREHFEELDYDNFLWMATSETWRILNESTSYEIHPGIYKNVKDDYKNNLRYGLSKIEE